METGSWGYFLPRYFLSLHPREQKWARPSRRVSNASAVENTWWRRAARLKWISPELTGPCLWVTDLKSDSKDAGLQAHAMEAASGHFLRDVFGWGAQVRSWWDACRAWLWPRAPGTTVPRRPRADPARGSGCLAPVCRYWEGIRWNWRCPALLHLNPFIFLVNEPRLCHLCSHVRHALITILSSKQRWTLKSQIKALFYFMKLWSRGNSSLTLILITIAYTHLKLALKTQHASSFPQPQRSYHSKVASQV